MDKIKCAKCGKETHYEQTFCRRCRLYFCWKCFAGHYQEEVSTAIEEYFRGILRRYKVDERCFSCYIDKSGMYYHVSFYLLNGDENIRFKFDNTQVKSVNDRFEFYGYLMSV